MCSKNLLSLLSVKKKSEIIQITKSLYTSHHDFSFNGGIKYTIPINEIEQTPNKTRPTTGIAIGLFDINKPTKGGQINCPKLAPLI